jgi:hypothetical protein
LTHKQYDDICKELAPAAQRSLGKYYGSQHDYRFRKVGRGARARIELFDHGVLVDPTRPVESLTLVADERTGVSVLINGCPPARADFGTVVLVLIDEFTPASGTTSYDVWKLALHKDLQRRDRANRSLDKHYKDIEDLERSVWSHVTETYSKLPSARAREFVRTTNRYLTSRVESTKFLGQRGQRCVLGILLRPFMTARSGRPSDPPL